MGIKSRIIGSLLLCSFVIVSVHCQKQKTEWRGTIEESDGVIVVKNPKEPIYSDDVLSIREELEIGKAEGTDEYLFTQIRGMDVDENENIYMLDIKDANIKVFDRNGSPIRTIGKPGQGPGELSRPTFMWISSKNEIMVEDPLTRRLAFYSLDGTFLRNVSTAKNLIIFARTDSLGNIIGATFIPEEENPRFELRKYDPELNFILTLATLPQPSLGSRIYNPFSPTMKFNIGKGDFLVYGAPDRYEFEVIDLEGNTMRRIFREYDPVDISDEDKEKAKKNTPPNYQLELPQHYPGYQWLYVDDERRTYVRTYEQEEGIDGYYFDVFDLEGKYLAKFILKDIPFIFKKGKIYSVEDTEDGFQVVKRYRMDWSEQ